MIVHLVVIRSIKIQMKLLRLDLRRVTLWNYEKSKRTTCTYAEQKGMYLSFEMQTSLVLLRLNERLFCCVIIYPVA